VQEGGDLTTSAVEERVQRILGIISQGIGRPAQIAKKACLDSKQTTSILSELRKKKLIEMIDGEYVSKV
jgi:hypothetical protein